MTRHYDTLIVGAGSAGAVLAARLSEDSERSVCLLEAGPDFQSVDALPRQIRGFDFSDRPYGGRRAAEYEWAYVARATDSAQPIAVPRGRIVGGCSSINGAVFLRALRSDLDTWAALGNPDWSYEQCLPYYKKLESDMDFGDEWHGQDGPIPVSRAARADWLAPSVAFYEACTELGQPLAPDMNRADARGVGPIPTNFRKGIRHSSAIGYLFPARGRENLDILGDVVVRRVRLDGQKATGVECLRDGRLERIEADNVILSAGAIGSPHLLMLSGIGPADQLRACGIETVVDLQGVGQHVRDHPFVLTVWDTFGPGGLDPQTGLPWQVQIRTSSGLPDDSWLTMIMSTMMDAEGGSGFTIPCSLMYAKSTGELRLRSSDPSIPPLVDFNYLSDPSDLERLRRIVRLALDIGNNAAFDSIRAGLRRPLTEELASDARIDEWIARTITTGHHISCTNRMGPSDDPTAVVDQLGRVHGMDNLRVVDASIMPDCPSVNLNATVIMLAEKLADAYRRSPTDSATRSSRSIPV